MQSVPRQGIFHITAFYADIEAATDFSAASEKRVLTYIKP